MFRNFILITLYNFRRQELFSFCFAASFAKTFFEIFSLFIDDKVDDRLSKPFKVPLSITAFFTGGRKRQLKYIQLTDTAIHTNSPVVQTGFLKFEI
ncbi:MAG: hypothetical protein WDO71_06715 [Bacteroidota bacterium]